jgi:hypothetical protein
VSCACLAYSAWRLRIAAEGAYAVCGYRRLSTGTFTASPRSPLLVWPHPLRSHVKLRTGAHVHLEPQTQAAAHFRAGCLHTPGSLFIALFLLLATIFRVGKFQSLLFVAFLSNCGLLTRNGGWCGLFVGTLSGGLSPERGRRPTSAGDRSTLQWYRKTPYLLTRRNAHRWLRRPAQ